MNEHASQSGPTKRQLPNDLNQALGLIDSLQSEVDRLQDQLAWADRLGTLGTLAAALAHEYNNLLTPIGSYAQLALSDLENAELTRKALTAAVKGTAQAGRLADAMLGFASPSNGGDDDETSCRAEAVVNHATEGVSPGLKGRDITIDCVVEDAQVAIGSLALQQVVMNLVSNAVSAVRDSAGGSRVWVAGQIHGGSYVLEVSDNGPGIPESMREEVFEPFISSRAQRSASSAQAEQGGTGLGLSICKQLIETAGGTIRLGESPEGGACFRVDLALADDSPAQRAE